MGSQISRTGAAADCGYSQAASKGEDTTLINAAQELLHEGKLEEARLALASHLGGASGTRSHASRPPAPTQHSSRCRVRRAGPSLEADQALRNGLALQPKPVLQIPHIKNIEALAVSPDAKSLVIVDAQDETASIIDINTRAPLASVDHDKQITSAAYSPTGKLLATGSRDQTVRLWSTTDYKEIARLPHDDRVYAVAFSPDGKFLASGSGTMGTHRPGKPPETRKGRLRVWALDF